MTGEEQSTDAPETPKRGRARAGTGGKDAQSGQPTATAAIEEPKPEPEPKPRPEPKPEPKQKPKLTLLQRLAAVQGEVDYIQKEKKQGMRYSIVSHDAVTAKVRPLMVKHGVLYYPSALNLEQAGNRTQARMVVRFVSVDDSADFIEVMTAGYGIDDSDKGPGKAISYAVKYALLKCLGLESGDDPDEDQTSVHKDPGNPHAIAMNEFEAEIELARSTAELEGMLEKFRPRIEAAAAVNAARVQLARQRYTARMRALRGLGKEGAE